MKRNYLPLMFACGSLVLSTISIAQPIVPGLNGFGVETAAGRGGTVYTVTSLEADGPGSLAECVYSSGPRICVFEVSGVISLTKNLTITNPHITIAGQTAPAPGITLIGAGLGIGASDVLVQHIAVRPGDRLDGPIPDNRDALLIGGAINGPLVNNVVVDHCSFSWSIDEMMSAWQNWDNVTISNSILGQALHNSLHSKNDPNYKDPGHGLGPILGPGPGKITFVRNLFAHLHARNPLSNTAGLVFVNNVVYNFRNLGTDLQGSDGIAQRVDIVDNLYLEGSDWYGGRPVRVSRAGSDMPSGSRVYLAGNQMLSLSGASLPVLENNSGGAIVDTPNWATYWRTVGVNGQEFLSEALSQIGSHPGQRTSQTVDGRIIDGVINRTGNIINCVEADGSARCSKNAGGWPVEIRNTTRLSLPVNSSDDDDNDGYTNLENWLHQIAAQVEGRVTGGTKPNPPNILN